jgi:hypothetical protein
MMNSKERQEQLNAMKVAELKALAAEYQIKVSGKKADIIQQLLNYESERDNAEEEANKPVWWNLVVEMNKDSEGNPVVFEHVKDRTKVQQILLHTCRDLYLDSQRAIKASNGDKNVKQFGPVFVSKKHNGLRMKDSMAKATVKSAAEKVFSKEEQKKFIVLNPETKHTEFKKATLILEKLDGAGLITGEKTDKDYAKFYTVNPEEILAFLKAVGCLK